MPIPAGTSAQALTQKLENMRDDKDLQPTEFAEPVGVGGGVEPDHENETQDTYCPIPVDATAHPQESGGPNDVRPKDVPRESGGPKDVPQESDGAKDVPQEFDGANDVPRESGGATMVPKNLMDPPNQIYISQSVPLVKMVKQVTSIWTMRCCKVCFMATYLSSTQDSLYKSLP